MWSHYYRTGSLQCHIQPHKRGEMLVLWSSHTGHMGVWCHTTRQQAEMRQKSVAFVLLGVLIVGSIAAPLVSFRCDRCDGKGYLECPICRGGGVAPHFFFVDCPCKGNPECTLCNGFGFYPSITTRPCKECHGKGWIPCPSCRGDGQRSLLERIVNLGREQASD